ncbi:unnamed protein product [Cuscuta epithymum]|uniref:F-box domain-containing protein n=1 Tax=Cuscuta epithymum TaxID=186058 RepID=A0AAV0EMV2_9ASTE|nr:unnamed protein product [Cuscuta epithymum]CAH9123342.1 unnamed protein product [Cuscuta epithymum]
MLSSEFKQNRNSGSLVRDNMETCAGSYSFFMPMDVLTEILIQLPMKSLIRLAFVCKSWFHLIRSDPQFALRHYLTRTRPSSSTLMDNVDYILDHPVVSIPGHVFTGVWRWCIYSLTEKKTFRHLKTLESYPPCARLTSNLCHGLICVIVYPLDNGPRMLLCNPGIGEVVSLQRPECREIVKVGLGYDPTCNNYKVVTLSAFKKGRTNSWTVDVYSVRDGCWHTLHDTGSLQQFHSSSFDGEAVLNANGRVINWLGFHKKILSFDVVNEVFRGISMPECLHLTMWRTRQHILTSSGCEACLCCSSRGTISIMAGSSDVAQIWVLKRDAVRDKFTWKKQFSLNFSAKNPGVVGPVNLWMNKNELFVHVMKPKCTRVEVYHYDRTTHELKPTGRLGWFDPICGYTESLISVKQLVSSSYHLHSAASVARDDEKKGCACVIREVGTKENDVHWSYYLRPSLKTL